MGWFKRKKVVSEGADPSVEMVAKKFADRILSAQRRLADKLNTRARKLEPRLLKALLLGTGLLFAGYCFWLVIGGLVHLV